MTLLSPSGKPRLKRTDFDPKPGDRVIAYDRNTGKEACGGVVIVNSMSKGGAICDAVDSFKRPRNFAMKTWRLERAGRRRF